MKPDTAQSAAQDPRQKAILSAAFEAFRTYGFRRTSMEDIALGAGMSRAALYLHYKNKEDIFRSLGAFYYANAQSDVAAVLAQVDTPARILERAFAAQAGPLFEALLNSPHGEELLDTKYAHAADIAVTGEAALTALYADWLRREMSAGRITIDQVDEDPEAVAETITTALHGLKTSKPDHPRYVAASSRLARLFGRALSP